MNKLITSTLLVALFASASVQAFGLFSVDIDQQIKYDEERISEYEKAIKELKKEIEYLKKEKKKNPELYVQKPRFEDLKDRYIYRIKLNGAQTEALNFVVKDSIVSLSMNIKNEQKEKGSYFYSSRYFSKSYSVPEDVDQEKIKHSTEGDYFVIEMPKKK